MSEKRLATRNKLYSTIEVNLYCFGKEVKGRVIDIGATGLSMDCLTRAKWLQKLLKVDVKVFFDPENPTSSMKVEAKGIVRWIKEKNNQIGIQFTEIDISKLGECTIYSINKEQISLNEPNSLYLK
ncbi:MAG: PilZ domain-containing protein [Desulfobacterales bacterium]|nr:PilZ domain-containing protein [Desulfobacterales bacterium]